MLVTDLIKNLALKSPHISQCFILILVVALKLKQNLGAANANGMKVWKMLLMSNPTVFICWVTHVPGQQQLFLSVSTSTLLAQPFSLTLTRARKQQPEQRSRGRSKSMGLSPSDPLNRNENINEQLGHCDQIHRQRSSTDLELAYQIHPTLVRSLCNGSTLFWQQSLYMTGNPQWSTIIQAGFSQFHSDCLIALLQF